MFNMRNLVKIFCFKNEDRKLQQKQFLFEVVSNNKTTYNTYLTRLFIKVKLVKFL